MNLTELRERVYDILEEDEEGVPSALLDLFAQDGFDRVVSADRRWPWFQSTETLTTVTATQAYTPPLREVTRIIRPASGRLQFLNHADAVEDYAGEAGTPDAFSVWGNQIFLWPSPEATETFTLLGYRAPSDWQANPAVEIDIDPEFHMAILYWVLSRYYARIEDVEMAAFYEQMFVSGVASAQQSVKARNSHESPLILNGGAAKRSASGLVFGL